MDPGRRDEASVNTPRAQTEMTKVQHKGKFESEDEEWLEASTGRTKNPAQVTRRFFPDYSNIGSKN